MLIFFRSSDPLPFFILGFDWALSYPGGIALTNSHFSNSQILHVASDEFEAVIKAEAASSQLAELLDCELLPERTTH